jgi:acetyl esterase
MAKRQLPPLSSGLRGRLSNRFIERTLEALGPISRLHPRAESLRTGVTVHENIPYDDAEKVRRLDLYRPTGSGSKGRFPTILYMHGGAFRILSKESHWAIASAYAQRGWQVFNIDYRLGVPFPAALEDACAAYGWLIDRADRFKVDLDRVVVAGDSAGANLATAIAIAASWPRREPYAKSVWNTGVSPAALVAGAGMLQVSHPERYTARREIPALYRDRVEAACRTYLPDDAGDPDAYALADVLPFLERARDPVRTFPRTFAGVGTLDPILEDTTRLGPALRALGVDVDVRTYEGGRHAFHVVPWTRLSREYWADQDAFLQPVLEG